MIIKEYLDNLLKEDKPVGDNNKEIWLDYLKSKYSDKDVSDLFVSFVNVDKIGINPNSTYNTPNGVYTYPMKFLLDDNKVPFRGSKTPKKIKILKAISKNVLDGSLSKEDYEKCRKIIVEKLEDVFNDKLNFQFGSIEEYVKLKESDSKVKTYFGKLWNLTRTLSKNPNYWSKLLIDLGFDWVNDEGYGIIHNNEPEQAVFLSPKSYKVIDEEFVSTESRYDSTHKTMTLQQLRDDVDALYYSNIQKRFDYFIRNKKRIMQLEGSSSYTLAITMIRFIFNTLDFSKDQKKELLKEYENLFRNVLKYKSLINIINPLDGEDKILFFEHFHKEVAIIIYDHLIEEDSAIYHTISEEMIEKYFPEVVKKFPKIKEESYSLESLLKEDSFDLSKSNQEDLYKTFKSSYEKSTGSSWDFDKFVQRSKNWKFYGTPEGFVTVRIQNSGFWKITGCAGSTKGILKGLDELISMNKPLWTAASGDIVEMLKKKGFVLFKGIMYGFAIKTFSKHVDKVVFGDEIENVESDGAIVFNVDGKKVKKYFACNKEYLSQVIKNDKVPEIVRKVLEQFL